MSTTVNGIHYVDMGDRNALTVTFLHGFPFSHAMWSSQLEAVGRMYRAVTYDIRGHGESIVGDGQYMIEGHVDDLCSVLDHLKIEKTVLVGLSMGGYIALRAMERHAHRFQALVLCDTRSEADSSEGKVKRWGDVSSVKKNGSQTFADEFVKRIFAPETYAKKPGVVEAIRQTIRRTPPLSIAGTLIALAARTDTSPSLPSIKIPTMILVGEHDVITPLAAAQAMHERIAGSEMHIVPDAGHLSNLENPDFFNEKLLYFLKKLSPHN